MKYEDCLYKDVECQQVSAGAVTPLPAPSEQ
jgi:hypothetical protein